VKCIVVDLFQLGGAWGVKDINLKQSTTLKKRKAKNINDLWTRLE
jgi:hypothetical protein